MRNNQNKHEINDLEKEAVLNKSLLNVFKLLALTRTEIASIMGASEATISRFFHKEHVIKLHSKQAELALMMIQLYRSLDTLFGGNEQQCQQWLRSQNRYFQMNPIDRIKTLEGLVSVCKYLDAMRGKT